MMQSSQQTAPNPAGGDSSSAATNPVRAVGEKAKETLKKNVLRPAMNQRPSIRLQRTSNPGNGPSEAQVPFWKSLFGRGKRAEQSTDIEKRHLPAVPESSEQPTLPTSGNAVGQPRVDQTLHGQTDGIDERDTAEYYATQAAAHDSSNEKKGITGRLRDAGERTETSIKSLIERWKSSDNEEQPVHTGQEYDSNMVDFLDVVGK
jgi:hypothetical protein